MISNKLENEGGEAQVLLLAGVSCKQACLARLAGWLAWIVKESREKLVKNELPASLSSLKTKETGQAAGA